MGENEVFENYYFILIKRLWMVVCIWPYQNKTLKFYGRALIMFAFSTTMIPLMIKFYEEWYEENRNGQILIENFTGTVYGIAIVAKLYTSVSKEKKIQHLFEIMTRDYKEIQKPEERAAMEKLWSSARILCIAYSLYLFTTLVAFVFSPQVIPAIFDLIWPMNESRHKMICYSAEYFVDQDKYLYILVLHTFVIMGISVIVNIALDTSYVTVTYHFLGRFSIISCRLKQLSEWADGNATHERLHNFIIDTIKIHKKTLDFAELVRSTYDACNFILVGLTLLGLSIGAVALVTNFTKSEVILRNGFGFAGVLSYLVFVNWPGQKVLDSSDHLAVTIYCCNWYKLPTRTQFLIRFMMMRCLFPCQLTAGPLFQMNFAFCGSVLRKALSFFMAAYSLS